MRKSAPVSAIILTCGLLASCGAIHDLITELPGQPTPVTTLPAGAPIPIPVVTPTPVLVTNPPPIPTAPGGGTPAPNPTPAPGPTPVPTPSSEPAPPPTSNGCGLPPQSPNPSCTFKTAQFAADVEWAIDQVINSKPQFFDLSLQRGPRSPFVLNVDGYTNATYDGEELAMKNSQGFNEQYDIHTSTGYVRRGEGAYRATCTPAWF
jgi:hypothetical protein